MCFDDPVHYAKGTSILNTYRWSFQSDTYYMAIRTGGQLLPNQYSQSHPFGAEPYCSEPLHYLGVILAKFAA